MTPMGRGLAARRVVAVALVAGAAAVISGLDATAQLIPLPGESTTTTAPPPPPSTTTTTEPIGGVFGPTTTAPPTTGTEPPPPTTAPTPGEPGAPAPAGPNPPDPGEGDGGDPGIAGGLLPRAIPPEAQAVINSIARTPANNNDALVQGAALIESLGVARDDAVRAVFGRFPVLGPTRWSDDWYFPRWTGAQFRFHLGLDMFAPYGTPVAAPVDGVARIAENPLGGLTVRVVEPSGTYWYLAHLSGIAPGLVDAQPVTAGQVVGFVGTSGNAVGTPPHVHFGVYPQGGAAAPPKPVVDAWVAEGAARVPELLAQLGVAAPATAAAGTVYRASGTEVGPPTAGSPSRGELLWASAASPAGGAVALADAAAAAAGERIDWVRRAAEQRAMDLAWSQSAARAAIILGPLTNPTLRQVVESLRGSSG